MHTAPILPPHRSSPWCPALALLATVLVSTPLAAAVSVVHEQHFESSTLPTTGWGFWTGDGGTVAIATDTTKTHGGSAGSMRGTYPARDSAGGGYVWCAYDVSALATRELYIDFWAKMPSTTKQGLKFLKIFGKRGTIDDANYANTTFGLDYTGVDVGGMYCVSYGDGSVVSNDTASVINFNGSNGSWMGRSYGTAVVSTPQGRIWASSNWGTTWHHFRMRVKFNSGTSAANEVADGAYFVEIDGLVYVDARNIFNRHWSNGPIDRVELFGWTQTGTTPFELWYDDVTITTGGFAEGTPSNQAPVAQAQSVSTGVDTARVITLLATDADGDAVTYAIASGPAHGTLSGSGAARTYTPAAGYSGADSFTFTASDGTATSPAATVTITVSSDTTPPARPSAPLVSDAGKQPTLSGVTEAGATVRIYDGGLLVGSVVADGDGAWSWTPAAALDGGAHGFTVIAVDTIGNASAASPAATVHVAVTGGIGVGNGMDRATSGGGDGGGCGAGGLAIVLAVLAGLRLRSTRRAAYQVGPLCLLMVVCSLAGRAWAAEYHVTTGGSDAASGASSAPWRTIGHAAALAVAGDTVVIHAGTYALGAQINFVNSGAAGNPITYRANSGDSVLIDGGSGYCLGLQFRNHLIFQDLGFTTASTAVGAGMVYMEGTNHCEFLGCTFSDMPAPTGSENTAAVRCMQTETGQSVGCVFRDNLFIDCRSPALRLYDTDGWIIENNEFVDCLEAVGGKDQPNNMLVRRNRITGGNIAFYFAGQSGCTNVTITENIVVGAEIGFLVGGLGTYGNLRDDIKLYNNTFYECAHLITGWDDAYTRRQSYHSNIFHAITAKNISAGADTAGRFVNLDKYGSVAVNPAYYTMDWNCLSIPAGDTSLRFIDANIRAQTIPAWTTAHPPFEAHSIAADPQLVDAAGGDFHLQGSSPCRGTGRSGNDMGAYPRGADGTVIGRLVDAAPPVPVVPGGGGGDGGGSGAGHRTGTGDSGGCGAGGVGGMGLVLALLIGLRSRPARR